MRHAENERARERAMRICFYSVKPFEREPFDTANTRHVHTIIRHEEALSGKTAHLAEGCDAVCVFVGDDVSEPVIAALAALGVRLVLLRSAGFNHVDIDAAERLGISVLRVPAYSPHAIAEHTVGLMLTLNRKIHRAYNRVREQNFALDGLLGFDMHGKTVGVVGTGRIGEVVCAILAGFGCTVLAADPVVNGVCVSLGAEYVELDRLFTESDVITLHCPLTPATKHMIDAAALDRMKRGVMLINTSRGAVVDSRAAIAGLKSGRIGALGLDVYEEEADLFFRDLSDTVIQDDVFMRLLTFPNVIVTAHQAFFTIEALRGIAETTLANATAFECGTLPDENVVHSGLIAG